MRRDGAGPVRIVYLHGFTQTHHHWHRGAHLVAAALDAPVTTVLVDLPGHGLNAGARLDLVDGGAAIADVAGRGTYVGYSLGGRFALHAALASPARVERLVLVGATPGIDDRAARAERRSLDAARADRVERSGVAAFLDEWLSAPLFATLEHDAADVEHRRRNTAAGLGSSLRLAGTGAQRPVWDRLERLAMPVLVIAGELDEKFTRIGRAMAEALPDAVFAGVPAAGHAAHAERPEVTAGIIARWLAATPVTPRARGRS